MAETLKELKEMIYPGRGIIAGWTDNGKPYISYFITGRSPSSQARKLVELKERKYNDAKLVLGIEITDKSKVPEEERPLIEYPAMMYMDGRIFATNGQQTELIFNNVLLTKNEPVTETSEIITTSLYKSRIKYYSDKLPEERRRIDLTSYEPDSLSTPRIAAVVDNCSMTFWIAKNIKGELKRFFYSYSPSQAGLSKMITTYAGGNENPILSFSGEPIDVNMPINDTKSITDVVFDAMGEANKGGDFRVSVATILKKDNNFEYHTHNRF